MCMCCELCVVCGVVCVMCCVQMSRNACVLRPRCYRLHFDKWQQAAVEEKSDALHGIPKGGKIEWMLFCLLLVVGCCCRSLLL